MKMKVIMSIYRKFSWDFFERITVLDFVLKSKWKLRQASLHTNRNLQNRSWNNLTNFGLSTVLFCKFERKTFYLLHWWWNWMVRLSPFKIQRRKNWRRNRIVFKIQEAKKHYCGMKIILKNQIKWKKYKYICTPIMIQLDKLAHLTEKTCRSIGGTEKKSRTFKGCGTPMLFLRGSLVPAFGVEFCTNFL